MDDINKRIEILRNTYTPADFKTFEAAYKAALKEK